MTKYHACFALATAVLVALGCAESTSPDSAASMAGISNAKAGGRSPNGIQELVAGDGNGINQLGDVVGAMYAVARVTHVFLWTDKKGARDLGTLDRSSYSVAYGVNDYDVIAGASGGSDGRIHAVVWQSGSAKKNRNHPHLKILDLGTFGGISAEANAINDNGLVVGCWTTQRENSTLSRGR